MGLSGRQSKIWAGERVLFGRIRQGSATGCFPCSSQMTIYEAVRPVESDNYLQSQLIFGVPLGLESACRSRAGRADGRYERAAPGEIVHIDIKKLGKFNRIGHRITGGRIGQSKSRRGWEYVHLAIDDHSRLAYSEILPDEKRTSCLRFLFNALRFFRGFGVRVERIMTDNGSSFRSHRYAKALRRLRIKHLRTKPYTPRTNGKAERFVQTSLREWAYARAYSTSQHRAAELPIWLHRYHWHRPHGGIGAKPPISKIALTKDNVLRLHN